MSAEEEDKRSVEQKYLSALRRLKVQADELEELATWKNEILSRVWRAQSVLNTTGENKDSMPLINEEIRWFKAVCAAYHRFPLGGDERAGAIQPGGNQDARLQPQRGTLFRGRGRDAVPDFMRRQWYLDLTLKSQMDVVEPSQFYLRPSLEEGKFPNERPMQIPTEVATRIQAQDAAGRLVFEVNNPQPVVVTTNQPKSVPAVEQSTTPTDVTLGR